MKIWRHIFALFLPKAVAKSPHFLRSRSVFELLSGRECVCGGREKDVFACVCACVCLTKFRVRTLLRACACRSFMPKMQYRISVCFDTKLPRLPFCRDSKAGRNVLVISCVNGVGFGFFTARMRMLVEFLKVNRINSFLVVKPAKSCRIRHLGDLQKTFSSISRMSKKQWLWRHMFRASLKAYTWVSAHSNHVVNSNRFW